MTADKPKDLALKIMALVDEYPSEPFSFERKEVENRIADMVYVFTQQTDDELDHAFNMGQDEGYAQAKDDFEQEIRELEEEVETLKREVEDMSGQLDQRFAEGYETASREVNVVETLDFK